MNKVVVNNSLIEQHPFWSCCGSSLLAVAKKDSPHGRYFCNMDISVLDLDLYEEKKVTGITDKGSTVDGVVGVALDFQNNKFISPQLLLVELKLNNESTKAFSSDNIKKKISHSIDLLGADIPLYSNYLVVFEDNIAPKFVALFNRWIKANELSKNLEAISVNELQNCLVVPSDWPIKSRYNESDIKQDLFVHISNLDFDKFIQQFEFWLEKGKTAGYSSDYVTSSVIYQCLKEVIIEIKVLDKLTEEDLLYLEILEESLDN